MSFRNESGGSIFNNYKSGVQYMAKKLMFLFLEFLVFVGALYLVLVWPEVCHASVESSLIGIKSKLTGVILPTLSVCGMALAGISFFTGQEKAKQHIIYAVIGCIIGFGAQAIVDFISTTVN
jgi:type IV secretory pathway VirB2 component (pilin)